MPNYANKYSFDGATTLTHHKSNAMSPAHLAGISPVFVRCVGTHLDFLNGH